MAAVKDCTGVGFCIYRLTVHFKFGRRKTNILGTFSFIRRNISGQDCCNKYNLFISAQCYFNKVLAMERRLPYTRWSKALRIVATKALQFLFVKCLDVERYDKK